MGEFTADERAAVIASVVSSQALAGVTITPDEAGALLDGLAGTPLPSIGAERAGMDEAPPLTEDALAAIERDAGGPEVRALCAEVRRVWAFCDSLRPLVAEVGRLRADAAALREVVFSLGYALGQWEQHGPPPDYDVLAAFRDMRATIEQARERALGCACDKARYE